MNVPTAAPMGTGSRSRFRSVHPGRSLPIPAIGFPEVSARRLERSSRRDLGDCKQTDQGCEELDPRKQIHVPECEARCSHDRVLSHSDED